MVNFLAFITVLVLYVILEKQPGVNCTQVGQGTECVDNAVCQNDSLVCTCTSDFYANGGMCATSKSYIKWQNIFRVTISVRSIVFFYLLITVASPLNQNNVSMRSDMSTHGRLFQ
jgi:hypothetical protein